MDRKAGYPNKALIIKQLHKTLSYQFGDDGVGNEEAGFRDAEAGADRDEVAGGEGGGESRSGAVGAEEVRIDAVTGAQTEHHTLEHHLIRSEVLESTDSCKVTVGSSLQI